MVEKIRSTFGWPASFDVCAVTPHGVVVGVFGGGKVVVGCFGGGGVVGGSGGVGVGGSAVGRVGGWVLGVVGWGRPGTAISDVTTTEQLYLVAVARNASHAVAVSGCVWRRVVKAIGV